MIHDLDDFRCNVCGNSHELCKCNENKKILFGRAELGSPEYEKMVDYMRADLDSGMALTKIEVTARMLLEEQGLDFDIEFEKWRKKRC